MPFRHMLGHNTTHSTHIPKRRGIYIQSCFCTSVPASQSTLVPRPSFRKLPTGSPLSMDWPWDFNGRLFLT